MIQLQEHEQLLSPNGLSVELDKRYNHLELIEWKKPKGTSPWGYYASYKIGAEWIDEKEPLVVTAKRGMENIDFLYMFMSCFSSNLSLDSFSKIYKIDLDKPAIEAPSLQGVVSPLIVLHFLGVVSRIKTLKKGYVHHSENLKKIKGHVRIIKNERTNIATKRYERIYCDYDEYSVDIPENKLIKKALLFSERLINNMRKQENSYSKIGLMLVKTIALFKGVSSDVEPKEVGQIHAHKLFSEYTEAIRLAKLILQRFDYSINKVTISEGKIIPFVLDMSLLYEHYVYMLLYEAYKEKISYQISGKTGRPDFLYKSCEYKAILDTKYIPKYKDKDFDTYVIRQLSGYSRDLPILKYLGYDAISEESSIPSVPCVIIYPMEGKKHYNPFINNSLEKLCTKVSKLSRFYKINVPIPTLHE